MSYSDKITKLANKFSRKLALAQATNTAQAADVEDALKAASLFDISDKVSPLLDGAKVSGDAKVAISIVVDKQLTTHYVVALDPPAPAASAALASSLKKAFGDKMKKSPIRCQA
jgi:hypothetical protein